MGAALCLVTILYAPWAPVPIQWPAPLPPAADLDRFPCAGTCNASIEWLYARRRFLRNEQELFPDPMYSEYFSAALADADARMSAWRELREAWLQRDDDPESTMGRYEMWHVGGNWTYGAGDDLAEWRIDMLRQSLSRLRLIIGPDNYILGVAGMPAVADVTTFRRID